MELSMEVKESTYVEALNQSGNRHAIGFLATSEQFNSGYCATSFRGEKEMSHQHYADYRVLEVISRSPGILLDQIVLECSDLTWNQVFLVLDHFSRQGILRMSPKGLGQYAIAFSPTDGTITAPMYERVEVRASI